MFFKFIHGREISVFADFIEMSHHVFITAWTNIPDRISGVPNFVIFDFVK